MLIACRATPFKTSSPVGPLPAARSTRIISFSERTVRPARGAAPRSHGPRRRPQRLRLRAPRRVPESRRHAIVRTDRFVSPRLVRAGNQARHRAARRRIGPLRRGPRAETQTPQGAWHPRHLGLERYPAPRPRPGGTICPGPIGQRIPSAFSGGGRCRPHHRAICRVHANRRHLYSLSRSAIEPHQAGRFGR